MYAQTQIFHQRIMIGRYCRHEAIIPQDKYMSLHFHCALGFATLILAHMLDSLVRVSRRVGSNHFVRIQNSRTIGERSDCPNKPQQAVDRRTTSKNILNVKANCYLGPSHDTANRLNTESTATFLLTISRETNPS